MLWGCFDAEATGALNKKDAIMRKENYVNISKQYPKTPTNKLKFGFKWISENGQLQVKILEWPSQSFDVKSYSKVVGNTED